MLPFIKQHPNTLLTGCIFSLLMSVYFYVSTDNLVVLFTPVLFFYLLLCVANWRNAYWLLICFIPISVQFELPGKTLSLSLPDEPMCWLISIVFILLIANNPRIIPRWWLNNPVAIIILFQFLWLLVSVAFSTVFFLSVKFLIAKIWYIICFFVFPIFIFKEKKDFVNVFIFLLLPILATIVVIMFRLSTMHFNFASIAMAVDYIYMNHVEYGAVISIFYPITWVVLSLTNESKKWIRKFIFFLIIIFIPVLYFTYARAAILAIFFAGIVGYAIKLKLVNNIMPIIYGVIVITLVYFIKDSRYIDLRPDYNNTIMHNDYANHLTSTFQGRDMSSMERLYRWIAAIRMSVERPFVGYGPHGFVYNYKNYTVPMFQTYVSSNNEHSTTHNYFLYMLTEQGWPAMLLYAMLIIAVLAQAQKTYHRFNDKFYKNCTLGLAMAFASCFVNNFFSEFIETHKVGALFYLIIALLMILEQKSKAVND